MGKIILGMDRLMRRFERAAWGILVCAAFLIPWLGVEPVMRDDTLGEGYLLLDWILAALMLVACAAQITRIVMSPDGEPVVTRVAAWLMLVALGLMTGRLTWTLAAQGDLYLTVTTVVAICCLCVSVLLHAGGRVVYGASHATRYGELPHDP